MRDTLGWRVKFAIITPGGNTVVQPEFDAMRPTGVTNNTFRISNLALSTGEWTTDDQFLDVLKILDSNIEPAVRDAMTCEPDHIILGLSSESIWDGGMAAAAKLRKRIELAAGQSIRVTLAADAIPAALNAYGVVGKVAVLTPYFGIAESHIRSYMQEIGFPVAQILNLATKRPLEIAQVSEKQMVEAVEQLNCDDAVAIVQFGANLPFANVAAKAEEAIGKPVIAVNTATYWHALRGNGISDQVLGWGRLLADH